MYKMHVLADAEFYFPTTNSLLNKTICLESQVCPEFSVVNKLKTPSSMMSLNFVCCPFFGQKGSIISIIFFKHNSRSLIFLRLKQSNLLQLFSGLVNGWLGFEDKNAKNIWINFAITNQNFFWLKHNIGTKHNWQKGNKCCHCFETGKQNVAPVRQWDVKLQH